MKPHRCLHFCAAWIKNMLSIQALGAVLSSFGALWLAVEISTFFFASTQLPATLRNSWEWFGVIGLFIAMWQCKPHLSVSHKLNGRDVIIKIAVGDLFTFPGDIIIGSNTTFDTRISRELISKKSVQGIFTKKYYGDETQLDIELSSGLSDVLYQDLQDNRIGKAKRYPIGTCVRLNPKQRTVYFVAIADINENGVASGTFNDLKVAMANLWVFIGQRGLKESLVMPVLGTGFTRLRQTREEIVHETIRLFIAACSERTFADKLTIVITPQDMARFRISLDELGSFLRYESRYVPFSKNDEEAVGTPA